MEDIKKCKIFVSHRDANEYPSLADAYKVIKEEVDEINRSGRHKDCVYIDLQSYQFGRDISNPNNGTYQSAESLKKDASNAHAVFILADGEMSENIYRWYRPRSILVSKETKERQVPMPILWNISEPQSKANCEAFHARKDCDYIYKYSSLDEFQDIISKLLKEYSARWATSAERKRTIPTLRSICLRRIRRVLIFCAAALSLYFAWPLIDGFISNKSEAVPEQEEQPISDPTRTALEGRISKAEELMSEKKYSLALDALKALKAECPSEYVDLKYRIDSLIKIIPILTPPPPAQIPSTVVEDNTYVVNCNSSSLRGYISNCIKDVLSELSKPKDGSIERWTLEITPDLSILEVPKLIDSDEYMVDIEYGIAIRDNLSKKVIHESTISTRGRSPASIDDAKKHSRQLAAQEIAKQLKQSIQ